MFISIVLSIVGAVCIPFIYSYIRHVLSLKYYPDGPFPWPIFGNMNLLSPDAHVDFAAMSKTYGDVFSLSLGMRRVVIVNSIETVKEALLTKSEQFSGRPIGGYTNSLLTNGFISDYTPSQIFLKKQGQVALKIFKEPKKLTYCLPTLFESESDKLHTRLREKEGQPTDVKAEFGLTILNIIGQAVLGERYEHYDKEFAEIMEINDMFFRLFNHGDPVAFLPWLKYFPLRALKILNEFIVRRERFFNIRVADHLKTYNKDNMRDVVDVMLKHYKAQSVKKNPLLTYEKIELISAELYLAALETTNATLCWMILYLLHWPKYQERIYKEIIEVLGENHYPTLQDIPNLHYTRAFTQESLRYSSVAPLGIPHESRGDSSLGGKDIPHGTYMIFNFWNVNHDERHWEKPFEFIPERWLTDEGIFSATQCVSTPYGIGKRRCIGEHVANNSIYVILARLMKEFRIERYPEEPFPMMKRDPGITLVPIEFNVLMKQREAIFKA